jgi:hypothetical protein
MLAYLFGNVRTFITTNSASSGTTQLLTTLCMSTVELVASVKTLMTKFNALIVAA